MINLTRITGIMPLSACGPSASSRRPVIVKAPATFRHQPNFM
jgi:hypothetical protein